MQHDSNNNFEKGETIVQVFNYEACECFLFYMANGGVTFSNLFNSNLPELNSVLFVLNDIIESTPVVKDRLVDYSDHKVCRFKV